MEVGAKIASTAVQEFKEHLHASVEGLGQRGEPDASSVAAFQNEMGVHAGGTQGTIPNLPAADITPSQGVSPAGLDNGSAVMSSTGDHVLQGMHIQVQALGPPKISGAYDAHHTFVHGFSDVHDSQMSNALVGSENPYVTQLSSSPSLSSSSHSAPSDITLSDVEHSLSGPANTSPEALIQTQMGVAAFHMKEAVVVASSTKINQDVENVAKAQ